MKVYIYKEYNDELVYGEEYIKVFKNREDAEALLAKRILEDYGWTIEEMQNNPEYEDQNISKDYVSIGWPGGEVRYYIVQEEPVHEWRI